MKSLFDLLFVRDKHVCPWWCCFSFDNPLRKLIQNPDKILSPFVIPGNTAIDIGPGMGYFSIPLCRLTGPAGKVIAVDIQEKMLNTLRKRAERHGVAATLITHKCTPASLDLVEKADFILGFWMVHEVPDQESFFNQVRTLLKPEGRFLIAEPKFHVSEKMFDKTILIALNSGLTLDSHPRIAFSRTAVLKAAKLPEIR